MDPRKNPYTPNAGARPPVLAGRDQQFEKFDILLHRLKHGYTEQSMLITGLRGVGKTVLLSFFEERAHTQEWITAEAEITKNVNFGRRMAQLVRRALLAIAPVRRWSERARQAAACLKSFSLTVSPDGSLTAGIDVAPVQGRADSGNLQDDLTDLLVALGGAAKEHQAGVVFLLDEIQFLTTVEMEALISGLHKTVQKALPVTLVGAGLPQLPRLAGEAKSYAERLFTFPVIGQLGEADALDALIAPARNLDVVYTSDAAAAVVEYTEGYPYFLQEYGKTLWESADTSHISLDDVRQVQALVESKLDESFFRVRADRTTETELLYLRAMAELGPEAQRAGDVAEILGRTADQLGPIRSRLVAKGLLYTPGYGLAAFTVPQFDRYMRRNHQLKVHPRRKRRRRR